LAGFHELLDSPHTQQVRQALARLYGAQKLTSVPDEDRVWRLEGETTLGPLLGGPCSQFAGLFPAHQHLPAPALSCNKSVIFP
jgi:hypothetical protein